MPSTPQAYTSVWQTGSGTATSEPAHRVKTIGFQTVSRSCPDMAILPGNTQHIVRNGAGKMGPGHSGTKRNEEADKEAKMGCQAPLGFPLPHASIAAAKHASERVYWRTFTQLWSETLLPNETGTLV